jgi:thiamine-phosphate diphosphorylase
MKNGIRWNLYLVTDPELSLGRSHEFIVSSAIRGGTGVIQYRDKNACTRRMIDTARILRNLCRSHGVAFIVNDRLDVALAVDADGIHVGQDDMPARIVRQWIGPGKILGISVNTVGQAKIAIEDGADYLGAGPVFSTMTKADAGEPIGLEGLARIARASSVPVVAISGINASNAEGVIKAGAAGIAVVSAIVSAEDVEGASRELHEIVKISRP